ncbi:MAG: T9SS type A sorting domain-containing protein [Bacteroidetes bacterium]|nr:MAG: T9SS type A sorting domain-containing protein [Bacteroidota bacterium]
MKTSYSIIIALVLCFTGYSFAQFGPHDLFIPEPTTLQYLNDLIMADSLANGARVDSERVYVLERGGVYLINTNIRNSNWTLRIKAQDTLGTKPVIYLIRNASTNTLPTRAVEVRGSMWLKNIIVCGYTEANPALISDINGALFTETTAGWDITIDSCIFTNSSGNHIRTDAAPRVVKVTNSIFANMGYLGTSNLGAGKAIDLRSGSCDSLIFVNNTFVNWQDRIIRHYSSTANIKYMLFDHNTLVNGMSYHGMLSLGRTGSNMIITNNLFIDPFALGNDSDAIRQAEFGDGGELDTWGGARMSWVISVPNDSTQWTISNNYYTITPAGQEFFDSASVRPIVANPPLTAGSMLTHHINGKLGADSATAFTNTTIALTNVPSLMTNMMVWYRKPLADSGGNKSKVTTYFKAAYDYDRRGFQYYRDTLDCTYPTLHAAYTGAEGGFPVGDLNWFPSQKTLWEIWSSLDVRISDEIPTAFALKQNYPNPFNPTTRIVYSVPGESKIRLEVYDMLGRSVATLVDEVKQAGEYAATFDGAGLPSGIYVAKLSSDEILLVRKMMLVK